MRFLPYCVYNTKCLLDKDHFQNHNHTMVNEAPRLQRRHYMTPMSSSLHLIIIIIITITILIIIIVVVIIIIIASNHHQTKTRDFFLTNLSRLMGNVQTPLLSFITYSFPGQHLAGFFLTCGCTSLHSFIYHDTFGYNTPNFP